MLARIGFGILLVLHALAHANAGMRAADTTASPVLAAIGAPAEWRLWIATLLWAAATVAFVVGGAALLGIRLPGPRWFAWVATGATASLLLAALYAPPTMGTGILVTATILAVAVAAVRREIPLDAPPGRRTRGARVAAALAVVAVAYVGAAIVARPWMLRWGSTAAERAAALPGDALVPTPHYRIDHAVTVRAPADAVWPWLAQVGQDRAGFYSYDRLERLVGARIRNVDSIVPAWQHRAVGDLVRAVPPDWLGGRFGRDLGWRVRLFEPGRALYLDGWGAFVVVPVDAHTTRVVVRTRGAGAPDVLLAPLGTFVFEPAHFVMERGMLLGIKRRAERAAGGAVAQRRAG